MEQETNFNITTITEEYLATLSSTFSAIDKYLNKNSTSIITPLDSNELSITKIILQLELVRDKYTKKDPMNTDIRSKFIIVDNDDPINNP